MSRRCYSGWFESGRQSGAERSFHCTGRGHADGDQRASLFVNVHKDAWFCGPCGAKGTAWQLAAFIAQAPPSDKPAVLEWLNAHGLGQTNNTKTEAQSRRIVATYPYVDEGGSVLFEVLRLEPGKDGKPKDFLQRKSDGTRKVDGVRQVPYRLPELLRAETVFIVEGEKDADNLHALGLTATCNPGGAGKWRSQYVECFQRHQRVIVIPDNDDAGRKHAQQVADSLQGKVASRKVVELAGLSPKGDVSDWLKAGGTRERLEELAAAAKEQAPSDNVGMQFTKLGDLLNEPEEAVSWLVEDHRQPVGTPYWLQSRKLAKALLRVVSRSLWFVVRIFSVVELHRGPSFTLLEEKRSEVKHHFPGDGRT